MARRWLFRRTLEPLGGHLRLFGCGSAFLPPTLQAAWEDLGIIVTQGYGSTEAAMAATTTYRRHPRGRLRKPQPPIELELAEDGEHLLRAAAHEVRPQLEQFAGEFLGTHDSCFHASKYCATRNDCKCELHHMRGNSTTEIRRISLAFASHA